MGGKQKAVSVKLNAVVHRATHEGIEELLLQTNVGNINVRYHPVDEASTAVVWVGGAGGGLTGPAGGLYPRLAGQLTNQGIASLRLDYRFPNNLENCVIDTLVGVQYLKHYGNHARMALVGHSFGGAVVISAGALSEEVVTVVALSSQTYGTSLADQLSPRSLLLMHGTADEILPDDCSRHIYQRAHKPKDLRLYNGCRHGLDECRDQIDADLMAWLTKQLPR
ncbi:alpha/beta hydrolase [Spirosoma soli]|uniref:Alpha/beta hydrolase n=1 Tax=Spirosoma soli TaxID=1770529 RepID=A0ABW5M3M7_9BACT